MVSCRATPARCARVRSVAKTPVRNLRVDDELWYAALARARSEQFTLAEVVRTFLRAYVAGGITPYVTATGRVLTDADIAALADEAERGYNPAEIQAVRDREQALEKLVPTVRIDEEL